MSYYQGRIVLFSAGCAAPRAAPCISSDKLRRPLSAHPKLRHAPNAASGRRSRHAGWGERGPIADKHVGCRSRPIIAALITGNKKTCARAPALLPPAGGHRYLTIQDPGSAAPSTAAAVPCEVGKAHGLTTVTNTQ